MNRVVWLNGGFVDPANAWDGRAIRPQVGLYETMRSHTGLIPWLDRHLDRIAASTGLLGLADLPSIEAVRDAARAVARTFGGGDARVRVTVTPGQYLLVEGTPFTPDPDATMSAVSVRGAWRPGRRVAEHKTFAYNEPHLTHARATESGADIALLLDHAGRLGEASIANVVCVIDGELITPPVDGLLPGLARAALARLTDVTEAPLSEDAWRNADELFVTNALRGIVSVHSVDGRQVGTGTTPVTTRLRARMETLLTGTPDHGGIFS